MRLQVSQNIGLNRVRLDFRRSPDTPLDVPSYQIDKDKADEFVSRYNKQEKNLRKITLASSVLGTLLGVISVISKKSKLASFIGAAIGTIVGFTSGTVYSSYKKNDLMDKYNVIRLNH